MDKLYVGLILLAPLAAYAEPAHQHWYHNAPEPGTLALMLLGSALAVWRGGKR